MVRKWGILWYSIGIGGTAVFMAIFFITRVPGNPITGRGGGMNTMSIAVEVFQAAFIVLASAIIAYEMKMKKRSAEKIASAATMKSRKQISVLATIVIALVLVGLLLLSMAAPRPTGAPPVSGDAASGRNGQSQGESAVQVVASADFNYMLTPDPAWIKVACR
ncbi:MAG: hypothetical protein QW769_00805 [Nitrososphaerales archaeon]